MLVLSCGDGAVEPPPPAPAPVVTTVTVTPGSATLSALEETARFTAEVRDQNGQVMAGAAVAWASSDASVASVPDLEELNLADNAFLGSRTSIPAALGKLARLQVLDLGGTSFRGIVRPATRNSGRGFATF